ncbi:tetratricopeptide repeat protein [Geothrix sp.]|jgi:tetratricopeptide (TPR) repeat protein|uniref:tetratricopeptide repeat protein n=1 Tax=Geothrix sp. TaxID=1962974 RepID=UPI0025B8D621|nr:tetratricopeptide repeat protein [Geothrix sp.]
MILLLLLSPAAQVQSQIQSQGLAAPLPAPAEALVRTKDWAGLADWFETVPPATRGAHYEMWIQALNRSRRWERLAAVCEALQPQLEAKSGPRLATYRLYRAQALSQLGRHGDAAAAHAENGRLGYPDGFPNACAEARLAQDWSTLQTCADALLEARPGDAMGQAWKGEALARQGRLAEAEPILREAVAKEPGIAHAWNNLGRCLNEKKAWTEACEALDRALTLEPGQLEALFNRGRARFELKRYRESRDDFRAALALRPDDPVLTENLRQAERYAALPAPKRP